MQTPVPAVIIRPATAGDETAIHRVMCAAFRVDEGAERWEYLRRLAQGWAGFLVLERGGAVAGAARIGRDRLRLGRASELLKGDVGYVSILPELQGQGLGTQLMQGAVWHLAERGFHLSRLGGLLAFYARFGYVPFPRRFYEFPLENARAGAATITPETFLRPSEEEMARLRPYDPGRDWRERHRLSECFSAGHTGALIEDPPASAPAGGPDTSGLRWVYEVDGRLLACANGSLNGAAVEVHGVAADPAFRKGLAAVVRRVLWAAVRRGATQASGRLPFDGWVESALVEGGVPFVLREPQTAPAGNMLRLVSLRGFAEAALPEWTARLRGAGGAGWQGTIALEVGAERVLLRLDAEGVHLAGAGEAPTAALQLPPRAFLLGALGHRGWADIAHQATGDVVPLAPALHILLRRAPCASGPLG